MDPVILPINGILDLHTFKAGEVPQLLDDYLAACSKAGIDHVRVIHGKGKGILKARVHALLSSNPLVAGFRTAPESAGGWGATLVELKKVKKM
jgi:DNA-nicking Smr family endonuclease